MEKHAMPGNRAVKRRERGFTLMEIMVVIFIIGLLIAVVAPSVRVLKSTCWKSEPNSLARFPARGMARALSHAPRSGFRPKMASSVLAVWLGTAHCSVYPTLGPGAYSIPASSSAEFVPFTPGV